MSMSLARIRSYHVHSMARVTMPHSFIVWSLFDPPLARPHHLSVIALPTGRHSTCCQIVSRYMSMRPLDETRTPGWTKSPNNKFLTLLPTQRSPPIRQSCTLVARGAASQLHSSRSSYHLPTYMYIVTVGSNLTETLLIDG